VTDDKSDETRSGDTANLRCWPDLSAIEQSLLRGGLRTKSTAGIIQAHGPLVRDGLLEVQYRTDTSSDLYTVIPLRELRTAFSSTEIWRDHDDADIFEGAHAVFTFAGYATWHTPRTPGFTNR